MEAQRLQMLDDMLANRKPRTKLGRLVYEGKITSLEEIRKNRRRIQEPEIVIKLVPNLVFYFYKPERVRRTTDAGRKASVKIIAAVGNYDGLLGIGVGYSSNTTLAKIDAIKKALLNVTPVKRGCGSRECRCGLPHSIPFAVEGKAGSVRVRLLPGPRGLGLVVGETVKPLFRLAGIQDIRSKTFGNTRTTENFVKAVYDALSKTYTFSEPKVRTPIE